MGEIGLPPIDFFMMMGLSMDGMPPPSSDNFDLVLVPQCIGPQPMAYYKGTKGVLPSWFENDYVWATNQSSPEEIAFPTHAFLVYMLAHAIFCGKRDKVYFYLLPAFKDLNLMATWS